MLDLSRYGLLMVEPTKRASSEPIIDDLTLRVVAVLLIAMPAKITNGGTHRCVCGARSDGFDYILPGGRVTNWLAAHYMAWHRNELPDGEVLKVIELIIAPAPMSHAGKIPAPR